MVGLGMSLGTSHHISYHGSSVAGLSNLPYLSFFISGSCNGRYMYVSNRVALCDLRTISVTPQADPGHAHCMLTASLPVSCLVYPVLT